jgi:hypothetical protein
MDALIGLRANLAIDAGAMGNGLTSADGIGNRSGIREIGRNNWTRRRVAPVKAPSQEGEGNDPG